jgi:hypothetical protein
MKKGEMCGRKALFQKLARGRKGKIVEIVPHYLLANQGL